MSDQLTSTKIQCPYCWEMIEVIIDDCGEDQQYVEDCQVCCQPIQISYNSANGELLEISIEQGNA